MVTVKDFAKKRLEVLSDLIKTHPDHTEQIKGKQEAFKELIQSPVVDESSVEEALERSADEEALSFTNKSGISRDFFQGKISAFEETLKWLRSR